MDLLEWDWEKILDCSGSGKGQVAGACDYGNEPLGSTKCGI